MERKGRILDNLDYQKAIDKIPAGFKGRIKIMHGGTEEKPLIVENRPVAVEVVGAAFVKIHNVRQVYACDGAQIYVSGEQAVDVSVAKNAHVVAGHNTVVYATDAATVLAKDNAKVTADKDVEVRAYDESVVNASASAKVKVYNTAIAIVEDDVKAEAYDDSTVIASGFSHVYADNRAKVSARDLSDVVADDNAEIQAFGSSRVEAHNHAFVKAYENVYVVAFDHSNIKAKGNAQVLRDSFHGHISTSGNARIIKMPETIAEYRTFYGLHEKGKHGKFYMPAKRTGKKLHPFYDREVILEVGKEITLRQPAKFNSGVSQVLFGTLEEAIHEMLNWGLDAVVEVEAELDAVPLFEQREKECKVLVLREVPKSGFGIYEKAIMQE